MTDAPTSRLDRCTTLLIVLLLVHVAMLVVLADVVPWTVDEHHYQLGARAIRAELLFDRHETQLHGPLPYYGMQFAGWLGVEFDTAFAATEHNKFWGRLGMLPFPLLVFVLLARLTRRVCGPRAAVVAASLWCFNPLVLGHAVLMTADMALTAAALLVAMAASRYLEKPGIGRLVPLAATVGIAMATKYIALLLVPALGLSLVLATRWRDPDARLLVRRPGVVAGFVDFVPVCALCAVVALVVLHACYLFHAGFYDLVATPLLDGGLSAKFVARMPGAAFGLGLLPDPFVRGIDFQVSASSAFTHSMVFDAVHPGHWAYYLAALGTKLPLALFAFLALALRWRGQPFSRGLNVVIATALVVPLVYLSVGTSLQIGVRYMLPAVPLLVLLAARPVEMLWSARRGRLAVVALVAWAAVATAMHWPHYIGAFNPLGGTRAYRLFGDSNVDWQLDPDRSPDLAALLERHPGALQVRFPSGPRLGRVIVYALDLWPRKAPVEGPVRHWLRELEPVDREGAFLVFDVAAADLGSADDRAVALLGAGRLDDAARLIQANGVRDVVAAQLELSRGADAAATRQGWMQLGRFDRVLAADDATPLERAQALFMLGDYRVLRKLLEGVAERRELDRVEVRFLGLAQFQVGDIDAVIATLDRHTPQVGDPEYEDFVQRRATLVRFRHEKEALAAQIRKGW